MKTWLFSALNPNFFRSDSIPMENGIGIENINPTSFRPIDWWPQPRNPAIFIAYTPVSSSPITKMGPGLTA